VAAVTGTAGTAVATKNRAVRMRVVIPPLALVNTKL